MPRVLRKHRSPQTTSPVRTRLFGRNTLASAIVVAIILWLAIVFAYAPSAWAMIVYRLLEDGGIAVVWVLSAAGWGAIVGRAFRISDAGSWLVEFVTAAGLGLGTVGFLVLGLGLAGWLNHATAVALLIIGSILGIARLAWLKWTPDRLLIPMTRPLGLGWLGLVVVPFAAMTTVGAMLPPGLLWTPEEPHGYDVVEYHLQVPREWFEAGRIIPLHHNVFSYFPFNVEMHYLLAMHLRRGPWVGMYLAQFMHGLFFVLAVMAAAGFASRARSQAPGRKGSRFAAAIAAIAMVAVPWVPQLGAIAYDEGGFLLFSLLAIGWALRALQAPTQPLRRFALAGAFAGLACGVKLTAVPEVLLAIPLAAAIVLAARRMPDLSAQSIGRRLQGPALCAAVGLMFFSPWLIRTAVWSHGNPVYPELTTVLGRGDFDDAQIERWHNAHSARPDQQSLTARLHALWTEVIANWQFGYLFIPAALASLVVTFRQPQTSYLAILLLILLIVWLFFTHLQSRFFILAVPLCALLIARLPGGVAFPLVLAQAVVAFILLQQHFGPRVVPPALGTEDLSWAIPDAASTLPADAPLALIGDERPFVYQRPMSLLVYRTVFDVKSARGDLIQAFAGPNPPTGPQWLLISPDELQRFARTYQPFPPVPAEIIAHQQPYLIER